MTASVHLGPSYNGNLVTYRNTNFKELRALFDITQRLIFEESTLCHDEVIKWAKAKVCVYLDSFL